jgi:hypothetical protein
VTVILGGRQPERALAHVQQLRARAPDLAALCVLDGDGLQDSAAREADGLAGQVEIFTWSRRHIESYLLVPSGISRSLGLRADDPRLSRLVREHLPHPSDEAGYRVLDAKRLLAPRGPFSRGLGRPLSLGRIARATPPADRHPDVAALHVRLASLLGPIPHMPPIATLRRL